MCSRIILLFTIRRMNRKDVYINHASFRLYEIIFQYTRDLVIRIDINNFKSMYSYYYKKKGISLTLEGAVYRQMRTR